MAITAQMVKELRTATGAGMSDCKKALDENGGDFGASVDYLRKKGAASAAKRSDREANEGIVIVKSSNDNKNAVLVEITSETDFVAKNQDFINYANLVADTLLESGVETKDELLNIKVGDDSIEDIHNGILSKFSEKIDINRIVVEKSEGYIESYIHGGSKLGVLLNVTAPVSGDAQAMVRDIAMQIAAMNPSFVNRSEVTSELLDKEKEIYTQQAIEEGKKPEIAERVASGRIEKYYKENVLLEQIFVKDSKKTISDFLKDISTLAGAEVGVNSFVRINIGE